jgi:hypothetical protein
MGIAVFPPSGAGLTTSDLIGADKIEQIEDIKALQVLHQLLLVIFHKPIPNFY